MNLEARIVFVNGQIARFNAEIAMMCAANSERQHRGEVLAYPESAFKKCIDRYECVVGHNAVVSYLVHEL